MLAAAALSVAASGCGAAPPSTPLLEGVLDLGYEEGKALIETRLKKAYPVGGSDADLLGYLQHQGLSGTRRLVPGNVENPIFGQTRLVLKRQICDVIVGVDWRANSSGKITEIIAIYSDDGCM